MTSLVFRTCTYFLQRRSSALAQRMMHSQKNRHVVAVCQFTSTNSKDENFKTCESLIRRAKECRAEMVFLPENFDFTGSSTEESLQLSQDDENGDYIDRYRRLAAELGIWLSLGSFHEKVSPSQERPYNTQLILNDQGKTVGKYRKLHLFDVDIDGRVKVKESDFSVHGDAIVAPVQTAIGKIGMATCYDLRFPEQAQLLRHAGAEILTYPSAFTIPTGMAHWETLLRARAIETQCYVIAAAQTGKHNAHRSSYGHAMIVDPWGQVVAQCSDGTGLCMAEINLDYVQHVRRQIPCSSHRRDDLYALVSTSCTGDPDDTLVYTFGNHDVPCKHVFLRTLLSYAFVNRKPVVKGHVLISPLRRVQKMTDMTVSEIADLFTAAQLVQKKLEEFHGVSATTVTVQDGPLAGQTVPHVHIHMLPRREGDFKDNEIYKVLAEHDKGEKGQQGLRDPEDMAKEAATYRKLFYKQ